MSAMIFSIFVLLLVVQNVCNVVADDDYDSSYYNMTTNDDLEGVALFSTDNTNQIMYRGVSCSCRNLACSCCVGLRIRKLKFEKVACGKIAYVRENSAVSVVMSLNQQTIVSISISVKNPPPLCVSVPHFSVLKLCIKLTNISVVGNKVQVCPVLETHVAVWTILSMHFNCLRI